LNIDDIRSLLAGRATEKAGLLATIVKEENTGKLEIARINSITAIFGHEIIKTFENQNHLMMRMNNDVKIGKYYFYNCEDLVEDVSMDVCFACSK
jgi:hypothetical protein